MPSWKKVITSGSNAVLHNITSSGDFKISGNISGSSTSTGSFGRVQATTIGGNSPLTIEADNFFVDSTGTVSGSATSTGSFGALKIKNSPLVTANSTGIGIGNVNYGHGIQKTLDVEGDIAIRNAIHSFATDNRSFIREWLAFNEGTPTYKTSADYKFHKFQNFSGETIMAIGGSSKRVGIGTESPGQALHVVGNVTAGVFYGTSLHSSAGDLTLTSNNSQTKILIDQAPGDIIFTANNAERMRINSSGNVGIGTASPGYKLDIVHNGDEQFRVGRSAQKYVAIRDDVMQFTGMTGNGMRIQTSDNSDIKFSAGTGDIIFDYGNSGGRVISYADIKVHGDIIAENYIVSSSVTHMTTSFSSGSTIFGDTTDDTHQFTGSLKVGGNAFFREIGSGHQVYIDSDAGGVAQIGTNTYTPLSIRANGNQAIYISQGAVVSMGTTNVGNLTSTGTIVSTGANGLISGSSTSTGSFGNVYVANEIEISDSNTRILEGSNNVVKLQSNSGYIEIGAMNGSYAHFVTDRSQFYFNKKLIVDEGIVQSYDENLILRRTTNSANKITIADGATHIGETGGTHHLVVNGNVSGSASSTGSFGKLLGDGSQLTGISTGGLGNIVEDTTPQLGGDLDLNSNDITGTGNISITGGLTLAGGSPNINGAGGSVYMIPTNFIVRSNIVNDSGDVKVNDNLTVTGNVSGSSTSTGSFGFIQVDKDRKIEFKGGVNDISLRNTSSNLLVLRYGSNDRISFGNGAIFVNQYYQNDIPSYSFTGMTTYGMAGGNNFISLMAAGNHALTIDSNSNASFRANVSGSLTSTGSFGDGRIAGRLGIQTTTPRGPIDVKGSNGSQGFYVSSTGLKAFLPTDIAHSAGASTFDFQVANLRLGTGAQGPVTIYPRFNSMLQLGTQDDTNLLTLSGSTKISGSGESTASFGHTLSPTAVFSDRIAIGQTSLDSTYELDVTGNINASSYSVFGGIVVGNANRIYKQSEAMPFLQLNGTTIQITGGSNASTNNIVNLLRRPDTNFNVVSGSTNLMFVTGSNGGRTEVKDRLTINQSTNTNSAGFRMKTSDDVEFAALYNYNSTGFPVAQLQMRYGSAVAARITPYSNTIRYQASDTSTTAGKHEFYSNNAVIALISATKISGSAQTTGSFGSLVVAGNTSIAGTITEASTMRIKTNIETLESPLDKISKLRGVSYNLKKNNEPSIGMIAEEVEEVFPELVSKDDNGKAAAMSYGRMTAVLLEAIKELKEEVDELRQENIYIKDMNRKNK